MFGEPLFNSPRTWKWAVPAAIFVMLVPITGKMYVTTNAEMQYWSMLPCGLGMLFLFVAAANFWKWTTAHQEEMFEKHQVALSATPLVLLAESMKQMHPEAVKVLNRFGVRTSWQVRVNVKSGDRDWVLADTNAHFGFVEHVLSKSGKALCPKRYFSEGSKKWDPDGLVTDREQYDDFENWLFARLMVTRSHGEFQPAEFILPWTPQLILESMGLTGEQDLYRPEEEPRKDLGKEAFSGQRSAISSQQSAVSGNGQNGKRKEEEPSPLTDEELEAIEKETAAYAAKYSS